MLGLLFDSENGGNKYDTNKVKTMAKLHTVKHGNLFIQYTDISTS
jgi:hypothetical protein